MCIRDCNYIGRLLTGRIESGSLKAGQMLQALDIEGNKIENFRVSKVLAFRGLKQQPIDIAEAGDIVSVAGMDKANVSDTLSDISINKINLPKLKSIIKGIVKGCKISECSLVGGETAETNENGELTYKELPDRFQAGFRNYVGLAGMESSVTFLQNLGWNNIRNHIISLSNLFIDEIGKISESKVFCFS